MKNSSQKLNRSGVALVIVLAMLLLLSGLIVAFFNMVSTERTATATNSNSTSARAIADSTVNLVIGQIREATTRYTEDATWASQPGAIRTFSGKESQSRQSYDKGALQYTYTPGPFDFVYKLYSSDSMRVPSAEYSVNGQDLKAELEVIQKWKSDITDPIDGYVDLNEPYISRQQTQTDEGKFVYEPRYPILDPRARADVNGNVGTKFGIVEGFHAPTIINPNDDRETQEQTRIAYLPMPVKWLYILKDGTIGPISRATPLNPVVGRTAFWTDDESTKLNINTASEGIYWDTPVVSTTWEAGSVEGSKIVSSTPMNSLNLAVSQPIRGEIQRYAGHPATTCLSPVFGWLWDLNPERPKWALKDHQNYDKYREAIYKMSPFVPSGEGTSRGGTFNTDEEYTKKFNTTKKRWEVVTGTKHLYNNVDELLFAPKRFDGTVENARAVRNEKMTPEAIEKVRGFITANSRSPEVNLFNRPKVTVWPVHAKKEKRTDFDNLFAFTSTVGGRDAARQTPFYFQREKARDQFYDVNIEENKELFRYLQWCTGGTSGGNGKENIPGFGSNFIKKYGAVQGDPGNRTERDQILTLIFDYVRCVNLVDTGTSRGGLIEFIPYTPFFGQGLKEAYKNTTRSFDWSGQVTPTEIPPNHPLGEGLHGYGRFINITEAALVFAKAGAPDASGRRPGMNAMLLLEMGTVMPGLPALRDTYWTKVFVDRDFEVYPIYANGSKGSKQLLFSNSMPGWSSGLMNVVTVSSHEIRQGRGFMPTMGFGNQLFYFDTGEHLDNTNPDIYPKDTNFNKQTVNNIILKQFKQCYVGAANRSNSYQRNQTSRFYPYVSPDPGLVPNGIPIKDATAGFATSFEFRGGKFRVEIWAGESPTHLDTRLVQTVELDFGPGGGCPDTQRLPMPAGERDIRARFQYNGGDNFDKDRRDEHPDAFNDNCTVRSIELTVLPGMPLAAQGDFRLAAAAPKLAGTATGGFVPASFYSPRDPDRWKNPAIPIVHAINEGHGDYDYLTGYSWSKGTGVYAKGSNVPDHPMGQGYSGIVHRDKRPLLPTGVNGVQMFTNQLTSTTLGGPGDWDRGLSKHLDGPFGNKVDEGNVNFDYGNGESAYRQPYFRGRGIEETGQSFFTPNRQMPSPVMFGSLSTGVLSKRPWQTLLFRPDRSPPAQAHYGSVVPEDHLMLEMFSLPIVEPYSISEPFATAGKVNLNYIMAPFGYLTDGEANTPRYSVGTAAPAGYIYRDTALRGVLRSTKIMAVPTTEPEFGHAELGSRTISNKHRHDIDLDETIAHMQKRLLDPERGLFRSASEICTVDLYPAGLGVSNWASFWDAAYTQTGDNMRERPYAQIYPRLTTKSNVFQVHMRCQAIRVKQSAVGEGGITELKEKDVDVLAEYRGAATIERYVDPNDKELGNYNYETQSIDPYYRFRVIATKQFTPR